MSRFPRFLSGLALMLALPLSGCLDTGPDVVCVDVDRVLSQSRAAQQANEHLAKVQAILQNGLDVYQEELKKSPEEKREQELRQGLAVQPQKAIGMSPESAKRLAAALVQTIQQYEAQYGEIIL